MSKEGQAVRRKIDQHRRREALRLEAEVCMPPACPPPEIWCPVSFQSMPLGMRSLLPVRVISGLPNSM